MRWTAFVALTISLPMLAQTPPPRRVIRPGPIPFVDNAESAIKQAADALANTKRIVDRDVAVVEHLRAADAALIDPMQPNNAVQKAYDEVNAAASPIPDFLVYQGIQKMQHELESARRSPMTADFPHLRSIMANDALGPARRVAVRDAIRIEDELLAWLRVQQMISDHVKTLSEISSQTLRASEQ